MKPQGERSTLNGFIDKGSFIRGDLSFEETFRIDGRFEGKIRSGGELILGDDADVNAEMEVGRLSVNGKLKGSVQATERVELLAGARVLGDISTPVLRIEEGRISRAPARWEGKLEPGGATPFRGNQCNY
jgi:cytoskeletal protein CcmA (bactofilin family)